LLVREEVLLADLCERKILFRLKIYDRLRQATDKRTGCRSQATHRVFEFACTSNLYLDLAAFKIISDTTSNSLGHCYPTAPFWPCSFC